MASESNIELALQDLSTVFGSKQELERIMVNHFMRFLLRPMVDDAEFDAADDADSLCALWLKRRREHLRRERVLGKVQEKRS